METTRQVWHHEFPNYELRISNITIRELSATKSRHDRRKLLELVKNIPMVMAKDDCLSLSEEYLKVISIPQNDALHAAIATIYNCDVLLSWNFAHLVHYQNRRKINGINLINGYQEIHIISPYEIGG